MSNDYFNLYEKLQFYQRLQGNIKKQKDKERTTITEKCNVICQRVITLY